jgi:hypothetical protein
MRIRRLFMVSAAIVATLILGSPSAGAGAPYWQAFSTNSTWRCGPTYGHTAKAKVWFQTCNIKSAIDYMQTVLVVSNQSGGPITIYGEVYNIYVDNYCYSSTLNTGFQRACFGTTTPMGNCDYTNGAGSLAVNGIFNTSYAPTVYAACRV